MVSNQRSKELKQKLKQQALDEDLQILGYQKKKDEMQEFRKNKEIEKFKEKQEAKNKLIKRQEEHLLSLKNKDMQRNRKSVRRS